MTETTTFPPRPERRPADLSTDRRRRGEPAPAGPAGKPDCGCGCGGAGGCPSCRGLETFARPRYFAGQLLTEDELRGEQEYLLAKNRLHNRYLHGWGVVCGLELSCDECPGYVTIHPGYALDPCGNDVVVPKTEHFDLMTAIRRARNARRRADCDPYAKQEPDCTDLVEHWCVTVTYDEQQRRPTTALRQTAVNASACGCGGPAKATSSGGCGCGGSAPAAYSHGHGNGNGYGNGHGNGNGHSSGHGHGTAKPPVATRLGACEPTRTVEGYVLAAERRDGHVCPSPADALGATFAGRVIQCARTLLAVGAGFGETDRQVVASYFGGGWMLDDISAADQYAALCRFKLALYDLLDSERLGVRCAAVCELDRLVIPKPSGERQESPQEYAATSYEARHTMGALLVDHVRDCLCGALLPPCPPEPCDDGVVLGCVRVEGDTIVGICNLAGRRYAGSFPALAYWTSLGPVLAWALCRLCCASTRRPRKAQREMAAMFDRVDPTGSLRQAVMSNGFAMPRYYWTQGFRWLRRFDPRRLDAEGDTVNMASFVGERADTSAKAMKKQGLTAERVRVEDEQEIPADAMRTAPFARRGDRVVLYESQGRVVGYARRRGDER